MSNSIPASVLEKFTTFGDLLRFLRRRMGLTQIEMSIAVGYSDAQISRLEQNLRLPDPATIAARFVPVLDLADEPIVVAQLLQLATHMQREDAPASGLCPYKGLNYFDETDADLFVGREALTDKLVDGFLFHASSGSLHQERFLAVVGASGSGKSSLVRAGLVPALHWNQASADWNIHIFTPGAHPLESLAECLLRQNKSAEVRAALIGGLARDTRSLHLFNKRSTPSENTARVLLVIDQFEELFTLCRSETERTLFIDNLLTSASELDGPTAIIITLRADFYAHCAAYVQLREALAHHQEYIGPMNEEELRRAIEEPARHGHWELEPGLVDLLLHDAGVGHEPGALPLLSHALLETWQRRRGRTLTLSGYTSSGGVRGAIAETAESVFTDQLTNTQQAIARRIFLRLTELGDEMLTGDTRRRATFNELILKPDEAASTHAVLKSLADARLITTGEDSVEVAHEALIREWPTLRGWLEDNRESLRLQRQFTDAAQEWEMAGREPDMLYRGARLAQLREWAQSHTDEMNILEHDFLNASVEFNERETLEREAQRQRELDVAKTLAETEQRRAEEQTHAAKNLRTRNRVITTVGSIAVLLAILAGSFGSQANQNAMLAQQNLSAAHIANTQSAANAARAVSEARIAQVRELVGYAIANLDKDAELSTLLALQAVSISTAADGPVLPEAEGILHRSVEALKIPVMTIHASQGHGFSGAQWSPDGTRIVSRLYDLNHPDGPPVAGTPILDGATGRILYTLPGGPWGIYWTNDRIITGNWSENVASLTQWDISSSQSGRQLATVHVPLPVAPDVNWSDVTLDFRYFIFVMSDGLTKVWDLTTGQETATDLTHNLSRYNGNPFFSRDGTLLALRNPDQTISIIDTTTWNEQVRLRGSHQAADVPFTWSYDNKSLVRINRDGTVSVWDVTTGQEQYTVSTGLHINAAMLSKDGTRLATAMADGQIILWDTATRKPALTIAVGALNGLDFGFDISPDGSRLVTTSGDGTLKVWDLLPNRELLTLVNSAPGQTGTTGLAYSPDGRRLVVSSTGDTPIVWDTETGQKVFTLVGHTDQVRAAAWSPDGSLIASGGADHTAILWNAKTGQTLLKLDGHTDSIYWMAFSPDGVRLATSSLDHSVAVWDVKTGKRLLTLAQPDASKGIAWSPDGLRLAAGTENGYIHIWNSLTGEQQLEISVGNSRVGMITFSPDGARLVAGMLDSSKAGVYDAKTGEKLLTLGGNSDLVAGVAYSSDGNRIATAGKDGIIQLWDAATGQKQFTLYGPVEGFFRVIFSPDGTRLATSGPDGTTRIYVLPLDELVSLAKSRLTRLLTTEECQQYLHTDTCPAMP